MNREAHKDLIKQIIGFLTALLPFAGIVGINFEWFNEQFINNLEVLLVSLLAVAYNIYAIWKNHYATRKAQNQLSATEITKRRLK